MLAFVAVLVAVAFSDRIINFHNNCKEKIWVGLSANWENDNYPTWWNGDDASIGIGETKTLTFHTDMVDSIGFWARTRCNFSDENIAAKSCCVLGDCECRKICQTADYTSGGTMAYAGTLGEITFTTTADSYDVSNIEGFHIPITVEPIEQYKESEFVPSYESCKTGGSSYKSIENWQDTLLGKCKDYNDSYNIVYEVAKYNPSTLGYECSMEGTELVQNLRYCIKSESSNVDLEPVAYQSFCVSDKHIAGAWTPNRPSSWPDYSSCTVEENGKTSTLTTGGFGCPACPGDNSCDAEPCTCCTNEPCKCPANYRCQKDDPSTELCQRFDCTEGEYPGIKPYIDWPLMMYNAGLTDGTYLMIYDDQVSHYACMTYGEGLSGGYLATFCPANADTSGCSRTVLFVSVVFVLNCLLNIVFKCT